MTSSFMDNWETQVRKGVLELAVLSALRHRRLYGYQIVKRLETIPGLVIAGGTIYPIMSRLQRDGLVEGSLEPSPEGPARKYYRLTRVGEATLDTMHRRWDAMGRGMDDLRRGDDECRSGSGDHVAD